jgi:hypothetical protein
MHDDQKVAFNKNMSRKKLLHTLRQFEPTIVIMEACIPHIPGDTSFKPLA